MVALLFGKSVGCGDGLSVTFAASNYRRIGPAQSCRRFSEGIKHGLQVERRPAHDLKHVAGGGQLPCSRLELRVKPIVRSTTRGQLTSHVRELTDELSEIWVESVIGWFHAEAQSRGRHSRHVQRCYGFGDASLPAYLSCFLSTRQGGQAGPIKFA
jgi:hypothetical protein